MNQPASYTWAQRPHTPAAKSCACVYTNWDARAVSIARLECLCVCVCGVERFQRDFLLSLCCCCFFFFSFLLLLSVGWSGSLLFSLLWLVDFSVLGGLVLCDVTVFVLVVFVLAQHSFLFSLFFFCFFFFELLVGCCC